jgi:hypothetical protein
VTRDADTAAESIESFSIAAVAVGGWLWLEELEHALLAREQLQMIRAMALALGGEAAAQAPDISQFDWPIHRNTQFDLGDEAARAGLQGFLSRQLQRQRCAGVVILGEACGRRLGPDGPDGLRRVQTVSTAAMLADPGLKRRAWRDLQPLLALP